MIEMPDEDYDSLTNLQCCASWMDRRKPWVGFISDVPTLAGKELSLQNI
jgi:hypothetical protein